MTNSPHSPDEDPMQALLENHHKEVDYWVAEFNHAIQSTAISIWHLQRAEGSYVTIIFDHKEGTAVVIDTDSRRDSDTPTKWMLLEYKTIETLSKLFNFNL
jgi:hypothetical protein